MKTTTSRSRCLWPVTLRTRRTACFGSLAAIVVGFMIGLFGPLLSIGVAHAASAGQKPAEQTRALPPDIKPVTASPSAPPLPLSAQAQPKAGNEKNASSASNQDRDRGAARKSRGITKGRSNKLVAGKKDKQPTVPQAAAESPQVKTSGELKEPPTKPLAASVEAPAGKTTPAAASVVAPESKAIKSLRGSADDLVRAGDAIALGRNSEAMTLLRKVLATNPSNLDARTSLIALLSERGRNDEWLAELSEAADMAPERFALPAATAHYEMNRVDDAAAILTRIPSPLRDLRHYALTGVIHTRLQQHGQALSAFDEALALSVGNAQKRRALLIARGVALENLGRKDEARSAYQATIDEGGSASALIFARTRLAKLDIESVSVDRP